LRERLKVRGLMSKKSTGLARSLRRSATDAESYLWRHLRANQLKGCKFRRQQPIADYIVDFVCLEKRIIIEVDGGQHAIEKESDSRRDESLSALGYRVLRFWNNDVLGNIHAVLERIFSFL